eukprot:Nk52_evm30s1810 gene=Nk52_evmTU30s1810
MDPDVIQTDGPDEVVESQDHGVGDPRGEMGEEEVQGEANKNTEEQNDIKIDVLSHEISNETIGSLSSSEEASGALTAKLKSQSMYKSDGGALLRSIQNLNNETETSKRESQQEQKLPHSGVEPQNNENYPQKKASTISTASTDSATGVSSKWKKAKAYGKVVGRFNAIQDDVNVLGAKYKEENKQENGIISTPEFKSGYILADPSVTKKWWILYPDHKFFTFWTPVILILLLYIATVVPYRVGFLLSSTGPWLAIDILIDVCFFIDMCIIFCTAYEDDHDRLVVEPKMIALHYLKGWFALDLISLFPVYAVDDSEQSYNKISRLARLPRLVKMVRFLRVVKVIKLGKFPVFMKQKMHKFGTSFRRLLKFFCFVFLITHLMNCLFLFIAGVGDYDRDTWVGFYGFNSAAKAELYIAATFFTIQTITTVGYGDIVPQNSWERIFGIILMLIGVTFYAFTVSNMSSMMANIDSESVKQTKMMENVDEFVNESHLPSSLRDKIMNFYKKQYKEKANITHTQKKMVLDSMSPALRVETVYYMHKEMIEAIPFFKGKDSTFVCNMAMNLQHLIANPGDYVVQEGEYSGEMYFITSGKVVTKANDKFFVSRTMSDGAYFGDSLLISDRYHFSVRALKVTELYFITRKKLLKLLEDYPEMSLALKNSAADRAKRYHDQKIESQSKQHRLSVAANNNNQDEWKNSAKRLSVLPGASSPLSNSQEVIRSPNSHMSGNDVNMEVLQASILQIAEELQKLREQSASK